MTAENPADVGQVPPIELDEAEALLHAASCHLDNATLALRSVGYEDWAIIASSLVSDTDRLRQRVEKALNGSR